MGYTIPNSASTSYVAQAQPDAQDFVALGDRRTGTLTGGLIAAQASPNMTIAFGACVDIINGEIVPYVGAGSITIQPADSNPRFDVVGLKSDGTVQVIRGTSATSAPAIPTFDPTVFCEHGTVYVHAGTVAGADVLDKRIMVPANLKRSFADGVTDVIVLTDAGASKTTRISSGGAISWVLSKLSRTADGAMQFLSSVTFQAADEANYPTPIIAKAGTTVGTGVQRLIQFVSNAGTERAYVRADGQAYFDNFKFGTGNPNTVVSGTVGDLYIDRTAPRNATMWVCEVLGNTGWVPFRSFVSNDSGLPTGMVVAVPVGTGVAAPAGWVYCNGASYATTGIYAALFAYIGYSYGGSAGTGQFAVPNYAGKQLIGAGGTMALAIGAEAGSADGTTSLSLANMPSHSHLVNDPGHDHPIEGFPYLWKPPAEPQTLRALNTTSLHQPIGVPFVAISTFGFPTAAQTDITIVASGGGNPFSTLGPVKAVNYLVKL